MKHSIKTRRLPPHPRRLPPHADYSDVVTDEYIERIKTLVPEEEYKDGKVIPEDGSIRNERGIRCFPLAWGR